MDIGGWGPMPVFDQYIVQSARFECFTASEDSRCYRQVHSTLLKLTCGLALPSLCPLDVTHMMNTPRPSLFSLLFHFRVLLSTPTEEQNRGRPGNEAINIPLILTLSQTV